MLPSVTRQEAFGVVQLDRRGALRKGLAVFDEDEPGMSDQDLIAMRQQAHTGGLVVYVGAVVAVPANRDISFVP